MAAIDDKLEAQEQWNADPCGAVTAAGLDPESIEFFRKVEAERYGSYAPWLEHAVGFVSFAGQRVLEIGPGLGSDHARIARAGGRVFAIDLTLKHLRMTRRHFELEGLTTRLTRGDAEHLPFADGSFDAVYSFGVLHHTPDTEAAVEEARRVLKPGGSAVISLYHRHSAFYWIATMLCRGVRRGELWKKGYRRLMAGIEHGSERSGALPLVRVFSRRHCRRMFRRFSSVEVRADHVDLSHVFPSRAPSTGLRRRRLERWAGRWGWYLTVRAQR